MKTVSVIIPCYNVEDYIEECLHSVLQQTYPVLEIICVDNNSKDSTWQRLEAMQQQHPSLVIARQLRPGANAARNKGLYLAKGEWIQFLDADDLLEPQKIQHQVQLLAEAPEHLSYIAGAWKKQAVNGLRTDVVALENDPFVAPFINRSGNTCSNLWRRSHLLEIEGWNEELKSSQEAELMQRLILAGGTSCNDVLPMTVIRERASGQISQSDPAGKWRRFIGIRLDYLRRLQDRYPEQYARHEQLFLDFLMVSVVTLAASDKAEAVSIFKQQIRPRWHSAGHYSWSKGKVALIRLFGLSFFLNVFSLMRRS